MRGFMRSNWYNFCNDSWRDWWCHASSMNCSGVWFGLENMIPGWASLAQNLPRPLLPDLTSKMHVLQGRNKARFLVWAVWQQDCQMWASIPCTFAPDTTNSEHFSWENAHESSTYLSLMPTSENADSYKNGFTGKYEVTLFSLSPASLLGRQKQLCLTTGSLRDF